MGNMTKFTGYSLSIERLVTQYRRDNNLSKYVYKSSDAVAEALDEYFSYCIDIEKEGVDQDQIESNRYRTQFLASEMIWNQEGCKVVFVETHDLAENLINGTYKIPNPTDIELFADSFMVALPKPLNYLPEEISSLLVEVRGYDTLPGEVVIDIRFHKGRDGILCNTYYIWSRINSVLSSPSYASYKLEHPSDAEDFLTFLEFQIIKLVGSLFVYACISKGNVRPGFPNTSALWKSKIISLGEMTNLTLVPPASGGQAGDRSKSSFYRTFHFRQLVDDRYYKGKYKELPKGSRIIPVKASYIGKEVDPYHTSGQ